MSEPLTVESSPIFKGCTRPPILFGVPMVPLLSVAIVLLLIGLWVWMPLALLIIPAYFVMKVISKTDEFRFRQWALWLQLLFPAALVGQRRFWDGCYSWSPANARPDAKHTQWILSPPAFIVRPVEEKSGSAETERSDYLRQVLKDAAGRTASVGGLLAAETTDRTADSGLAEEEEARFALPAVRPREV